MLTNNQMKANRFLNWAIARRKLAFITENLNAGRAVYVCTYTKATKYTAKHISMFRASKSGLFVQSGKKELCIDYCALKAQ